MVCQRCGIPTSDVFFQASQIICPECVVSYDDGDPNAAKNCIIASWMDVTSDTPHWLLWVGAGPSRVLFLRTNRPEFYLEAKAHSFAEAVSREMLTEIAANQEMAIARAEHQLRVGACKKEVCVALREALHPYAINVGIGASKNVFMFPRDNRCRFMLVDGELTRILPEHSELVLYLRSALDEFRVVGCILFYGKEITPAPENVINIDPSWTPSCGYIQYMGIANRIAVPLVAGKPAALFSSMVMYPMTVKCPSSQSDQILVLDLSIAWILLYGSDRVFVFFRAMIEVPLFVELPTATLPFRLAIRQNILSGDATVLCSSSAIPTDIALEAGIAYLLHGSTWEELSSTFTIPMIPPFLL